MKQFFSIGPNTPTETLRQAYDHRGPCPAMVEELFRRLEATERERDHYKELAESRWDGAIEANQRADALAARYAALADEVRAMIQDSDGLAGYHMNGEVACWSEFEVGHLLSEPEEVGDKVLARQKLLWQAEALEEQAEAYAVGQTLRVSMELQDAADEKRRQAEEVRP